MSGVAQQNELLVVGNVRAANSGTAEGFSVEEVGVVSVGEQRREKGRVVLEIPA